MSQSAPYTGYAVLDTGAVYRSDDGGDNWTPTGAALPVCGSTQIGAISIDPRHTDVAYLHTCGGVYRTRDGGVTWTQLVASFGPIESPVAIVPSHPQTLYAAAATGVIRSADGGTTWSAPIPVLGRFEVYTVAVSPHRPDVLYAGTAAGLYRSPDGGETWTQTSGGLKNWGFIRSVASDPANPQRVFAATAAGVWRSDDGGAAWQALPDGLPAGVATTESVTVDPADPATVYAQVTSGGKYDVSHDDGDTWVATAAQTPPWPGPVAIDPADDQHLVTATSDGVQTSFDGGQTVTTTTVCPSSCGWFEGVAFAPSDPAVIYAAGGQAGVWRSSDGGASWTNVLAGSATVGAVAGVLAVDPADPDTVLYQVLNGYVGNMCTGSDLEVTHDGGATWTPISQCVTAATYDPSTHPSTIYATRGAHEYRSRWR